MIRFVSGKLPDAHNIKVNSMFILCWGGHASIPIFYIPSLGSRLHLINFPSTVRFLISKYFANNVHSKSLHSKDFLLVALLSTFPTCDAARGFHACISSVLPRTCLFRLFYLDLQMTLWSCLVFFLSPVHIVLCSECYHLGENVVKIKCNCFELL